MGRKRKEPEKRLVEQLTESFGGLLARAKADLPTEDYAEFLGGCLILLDTATEEDDEAISFDCDEEDDDDFEDEDDDDTDDMDEHSEDDDEQ